MAFVVDRHDLKQGLIIFRRADVNHRNWYCRVRVPNSTRYKTVTLKTADINEARERAFVHDGEVQFRVRHNIPVFERSFLQVAEEFSAVQKARSETGEITKHRWRVMHSHIQSQLSRYIGSVQITQIAESYWKGYPLWRRQNGEGVSGQKVSDGTIRHEI